VKGQDLDHLIAALSLPSVGRGQGPLIKREINGRPAHTRREDALSLRPGRARERESCLPRYESVRAMAAVYLIAVWFFLVSSVGRAVIPVTAPSTRPP